MKKTCVIFDAFGTLLQIGKGNHPYRQILKSGILQGRRPKPDDAQQIMTHKLGLSEAAEHFGIKIFHHEMETLQEALRDELASIQAYSDGLIAVRMLQSSGFRVGVCSNLALPYAQAIERLYPNLDVYTYSFEVGAIKPSPIIYTNACNRLQCLPAQAAMIGDSQRCDRDGPTEFGMKGFFLDRQGAGDFSSLTDFAKLISNNAG
jgi:HAD superfamily hydrolase (TIGR01549 family)